MRVSIKIFLGYAILISFLVLTIGLCCKERIKHGQLQVEEQKLHQIRHLADQSYADLLELSTCEETVSVWDEKDRNIYHIKRQRVCRNLLKLKDYDTNSYGQAHIDSLCLLLEKKEELLDTLMKTFDRLWEVGKAVNHEAPVIYNASKTTSITASDTIQTVKKKSFWSKLSNLFKREQKESAYKQQYKKKKASTLIKTTANTLYPLNREVMDIQDEKKKSLLLQMDRLYDNSNELNGRLYRIVRTLESEADLRLEERYKQFILERERSFRSVFILAVFVSILTILLYIVIHRDLKRIYKYQKELELSDKTNRELLRSRNDMMLTIAHDLRSPLATISGSIELLPGEENEQDRAGYVENIRHSSDYMLQLVDTLMEFYLLDTGQIQPHISFYNLETVFREIADGYLLQTRKKDLRFSCELSGMDIVVSSDRNRLQQVVNNLLSNALKFTEKGGIRLNAEYDSGELRFFVQDTGCGMNGAEIEKIFTAFERLENARGVPGFGLGLTISYRLVTRMGGNIRVESHPGQGSIFTVMLPLSPADEKSPVRGGGYPESDHELEGRSILLLDDDVRQLRITAEMLKRSGAYCDICTNSSELVCRIRDDEYDVLLTDIRMSEMDGYAILELLRSSNIEQANTIPVVAMTAGMDDGQEYLSRGFSGYIRKPFLTEDLVRGILKSIGSCRKRAWTPDFSLLLTDEDNREEMLEIFLSESRKELSRLQDALHEGDRHCIHGLLHKNLPLWETVHLDYPVETLRDLIVAGPGNWQEKEMMEIHKIKRAAEKLADHAENMWRNEHERNNTDHRG